jgi:uroporphyrinogen decarboxylase
MTSRELVRAALEFRNPPRVPRDLWELPWAQVHYPEELKRIREDFVWDFGGVRAQYREAPAVEEGCQTEVGRYVDPWGCVFTNILRGVIGEVKQPIVLEDDWSDAGRVHIPEEQLSFDVADVNRQVAGSDKFVLGGCCPRPFEQLQFIRGTAPLYMDLMEMPSGLCAFLEKMHDFYCRLLKKWCETDVDAVNFMDDWGSQKGMLVSPEIWRRVFGPMYREYIDIAHRHGKKIFMHSDGNTLAMFPDLIDMGLDAINAQIFCIGVENLAPFRGRIAFWGEIDRQHLLPYGSPADIESAVRHVMDTLWDGGGVIAQCEFGPGANPLNVLGVFRNFASYGSNASKRG